MLAVGVQPTETAPASGDTVGRAGVAGVPTMIPAVGVLAGPAPFALTAATVNVALVELVSPVTVSVVAGELKVCGDWATPPTDGVIW